MRTLPLCAAAVLVLFGLGRLDFGRAAGVEPAAERDRLLNTDREFAAAARAGDLKRIFDFWTDDAVAFYPGRPAARGKEAIHAMVKQNRARPGFSLSWEASDAVVSDSGELGYTLGAFELSAHDESGKPRTRRGNYVCVWKKQPDGSWRIAVDCGTLSADPASARGREAKDS